MSITETRRSSLAVRGLVVGYGELTVVHGVDLDVAPGEVVALLGPNGAGKSTLLRAIAGLIPARSGTVHIGDRPAAGRPHMRARQGLAFVGDDRHILRGLTARQTARLVGDAEPVLATFPALPPLADRRCELLSGGEQQMLAIARALGRQPDLLVVDELSLGLAPIVRDHLLAHVRAAADGGTAVLVVEQSAMAVLAVSDRAYVMRRGTIVESGPAERWRDDADRLSDLYLG